MRARRGGRDPNALRHTYDGAIGRMFYVNGKYSY
jgi:hypothetical protein